MTGNGDPFELETDAGGGGFIGGAWQFEENMHLFGEYASVSQELEVSQGIDSVSGDFHVVRWRVGVGYGYPFSSTMALYGRLSFGNLEVKDAQVAGFNLDVEADENGVGSEVGMIWAATPAIQLQGHVRYTSVGGVATDGSNVFDSDILVGLNGRWHFRPNIALVTGYEFGKITTWNLGMRFSFCTCPSALCTALASVLAVPFASRGCKDSTRVYTRVKTDLSSTGDAIGGGRWPAIDAGPADIKASNNRPRADEQYTILRQAHRHLRDFRLPIPTSPIPKRSHP